MQRKNLVEFRWRLMAPLAGLIATCGVATGSVAGQVVSIASAQPAPLIAAVSSGAIMRTVPASLGITGQYLPTSGLRVTVPGDFRSSCRAPSSMSPGGFKVVCEFNQVGPQTLRIYSAAKLLGTVSVIVKTNVTGVTWTSPSTANSGTVKFGETVTFKVSGVNLLVSPAMSLSVDKCNAATLETGLRSNALRTFTCVFRNQTSTLAEKLPGVVKDGSSGQVLLDGWTVPVAGKLPDTGVTASQCYGAGTNAFISCTSAAAIALSAKQDGMTGRDVTSPDSSDGKLGFSYSTVRGYAKTECVRDNITGLMWEGKPASGLRANTNTYTNYGDGRTGDASAYVAAVNATALCGYNDWRLPTVDELQNIVDYGTSLPGPTVDTNWFPNTSVEFGSYWASTPKTGDADSVWYVSFSDGAVGYRYRSVNFFFARLVR